MLGSNFEVRRLAGAFKCQGVPIKCAQVSLRVQSGGKPPHSKELQDLFRHPAATYIELGSVHVI